MKPDKDQYKRSVTILAGMSVILLLMVSCLKKMPESVPENLVWNPEVAFPLGEDSFGLNAVSGFDTSRFNLDTITGLPEWVNDLEVVMEGTMDFNLSSISENLDQINRILFRVNVSNGFPNEVRVQAYFQDAGMNTVDSIFSQGPMIVAPGKVQGTGETIIPTVARQDAIFEKERIQPLENVTLIFFRSTLLVSDLDSALIPFYTSYHFDVNIGAMLDLTILF